MLMVSFSSFSQRPDESDPAKNLSEYSATAVSHVRHDEDAIGGGGQVRDRVAAEVRLGSGGREVGGAHGQRDGGVRLLGVEVRGDRPDHRHVRRPDPTQHRARSEQKGRQSRQRQKDHP